MLIVEDQPANVVLLRRILQVAGVQKIHDVGDPREAVQRCVDVAADLVMLDWHMPGMGGFEVLTALRAALPAEEFLPVVVVTADDSPEVRDQALTVGANDFLRRPFDLSEVTLRVRNLLQTRALHQDVQRHNAALSADLDRRAEVEARVAALRRESMGRIDAALAEGAFHMVFQPIVNVRTREILGVESLARFECTPLRPPDEWFGEAREVGRATELELAAVRMALAQFGAFPSNNFLSVNVSPETVATGELEQVLENLPAHRVVVELTEHSPIQDYASLLPALDALRERGARVAVDDAGAGYSGLRHVLRLRPEILKLDRDLTQGIDADPARRALATALVTFAREIDATIIAEGVETPEELETLLHLGVPLGQGFFLGRPAPAPPLSTGGVVAEEAER